LTALETEIDQNRRKIQTDAYPMSIGEMINLYKDDELDIHPEFQRIYRWNNTQKSKLIESILLGIPLPSIFVAQREDGIWDVVDGLQRLSTIFSFLGILKNEDGDILDPLKLEGTEYLPSLEGKVWESGADENEIPVDIKRTFKREKIDIKIIKKESEENAKYDLFQRLNTGGSELSDQEVRNCLLIMYNHDIYDWLRELSEFPAFRESLPLTTRQEQEQVYMEVALRFIIYRHATDPMLRKFSDLNDLLTKSMNLILLDADFDRKQEEEVFKRVFTRLNELLNENSFKKFSQEKKRYEGAFSLAVFEIIAIGLSFNLDVEDEKIEEISKGLPMDANFIDNTKYGTRSINRLQFLIPYGKELLK